MSYLRQPLTQQEAVCLAAEIDRSAVPFKHKRVHQYAGGPNWAVEVRDERTGYTVEVQSTEQWQQIRREQPGAARDDFSEAGVRLLAEYDSRLEKLRADRDDFEAEAARLCDEIAGAERQRSAVEAAIAALGAAPGTMILTPAAPAPTDDLGAKIMTALQAQAQTPPGSPQVAESVPTPAPPTPNFMHSLGVPNPARQQRNVRKPHGPGGGPRNPRRGIPRDERERIVPTPAGLLTQSEWLVMRLREQRSARLSDLAMELSGILGRDFRVVRALVTGAASRIAKKEPRLVKAGNGVWAWREAPGSAA